MVDRLRAGSNLVLEDLAPLTVFVDGSEECRRLVEACEGSSVYFTLQNAPSGGSFMLRSNPDQQDYASLAQAMWILPRLEAAIERADSDRWRFFFEGYCVDPQEMLERKQAERPYRQDLMAEAETRYQQQLRP